jgi:hypothetical protein
MNNRNNSNHNSNENTGADKFAILCARYPALVFLLMAANGSFITLLGGYLYKTSVTFGPVVARTLHAHLG